MIFQFYLRGHYLLKLQHLSFRANKWLDHQGTIGGSKAFWSQQAFITPPGHYISSELLHITTVITLKH